MNDHQLKFGPAFSWKSTSTKLLWGGLIALLLGQSAAWALEVGFAETDITPEILPKKPVWLAGYGMGRKATGIHDPLKARAVVLKHDGKMIALVGVDLIGLQYDEVRKIRTLLSEFQYVTVASSHNHEGPDVIGMWGRGPFSRGVDDAYIQLVVERVTQAVKEASQALVEVNASYGTATDDSLVGDSRLPEVKDGVLRLIRFRKVQGGADAGMIVQWNCHPEALGSRNTLVTADFLATTIAELEKRHNCQCVYLSGALGGLLAPPRGGRIKSKSGDELKEGDYAYAERYGEEVADLADQAWNKTEPIELTPFAVSAKTIAIPVRNVLYRAGRVAGVLKRSARVWSGDFNNLGEPLTPEMAVEDLATAVESEVACIRLGELHVGCIPGELYPELVYGKFQDPIEAKVDFPDAPREPTFASLMPSSKWLLLGLANDEIGYIIPKSQWDSAPPYAYGRDEPQYGEINSCGPEVAPIIMEALKQRVAELPK